MYIWNIRCNKHYNRNTHNMRKASDCEQSDAFLFDKTPSTIICNVPTYVVVSLGMEQPIQGRR